MLYLYKKLFLVHLVRNNSKLILTSDWIQKGNLIRLT